LQGINLANIIKDLSVNPQTGQPVINETVDKIKEHIGQKLEETTEFPGSKSNLILISGNHRH